MGYVFSDPAREGESYALPDVEVWQEEAVQLGCCGLGLPASMLFMGENCHSCGEVVEMAGHSDRESWWAWFCFPGCLPEGDGVPSGPFGSEQEAIEAMREQS